MSADTYNGWTNYETWSVVLWVDNDQGFHESAREIVAGRNDYKAAGELSEWVEEWALEGLEGFQLQAVAGFLSEVRWSELVEHFAGSEVSA